MRVQSCHDEIQDGQPASSPARSTLCKCCDEQTCLMNVIASNILESSSFDPTSATVFVNRLNIAFQFVPAAVGMCFVGCAMYIQSSYVASTAQLAE
jgi:hypothetical protein